MASQQSRLIKFMYGEINIDEKTPLSLLPLETFVGLATLDKERSGTPNLPLRRPSAPRDDQSLALHISIFPTSLITSTSINISQFAHGRIRF